MKRIKGREERGAATVEFAIIALVLFSLVFGIIEFGILMFDKQVLTNASREAARAGAVMRVPRLDNVAIEAIVNKYAEKYMVSFDASNTAQLKTIVKPDYGTELIPGRNYALFGTDMVVTVTYPFEFLILSNFGLGPILLKAETHMRLE